MSAVPTLLTWVAFGWKIIINGISQAGVTLVPLKGKTENTFAIIGDAP